MGDSVTIKLEHADTELSRLMDEHSVYKTLGQSIRISQVIWFGHKCGYTAMVTNILGPSLETLLGESGGWFSLKTVSMLMTQLV